LKKKKIYLRFLVGMLIFLLDFLKTGRCRKFFFCTPRDSYNFIYNV